MEKENSKDEINENKETEEIVKENNKFLNSQIEPKRIKIPLIGLVLAFMIILTGIIVGAIVLLQLNLQ